MRPWRGSREPAPRPNNFRNAILLSEQARTHVAELPISLKCPHVQTVPPRGAAT